MASFRFAMMKSLFAIIEEYKRAELFKAHKEWGIVEPANTNLMAYGKYPQSDEWLRNDGLQAIVSSDYDVYFFPIDHNKCYEDVVGADALKCDGFIFSDDKSVIVFVELKNRLVGSEDLDSIAKACIEANSSSTVSEQDKDLWLSKASLQLRDTILRFNRSDPDVCQMFPARHYAYISNRKAGYDIDFMAESTKEEFRNQTGFELRINTRIRISAIPPPIKLQLLTSGELAEMTA